MTGYVFTLACAGAITSIMASAQGVCYSVATTYGVMISAWADVAYLDVFYIHQLYITKGALGFRYS